MNYCSFREYKTEVEKLVPNIVPGEMYMLKQYYKRGISPEDAVVNMFNFDQTGDNLDSTGYKKYNPDFEFEER